MDVSSQLWTYENLEKPPSIQQLSAKNALTVLFSVHIIPSSIE